MKGLKILLAGVMAGLAASPLHAADAERGKALHDQNCMACHGTEVYKREDRRMKSLEMLQAQVARCNRAVNSKWSADDRADVVKYLNETFYHFE